MITKQSFIIVYSILNRNTFYEIKTFHIQLEKVKDNDFFQWYCLEINVM